MTAFAVGLLIGVTLALVTWVGVWTVEVARD